MPADTFSYWYFNAICYHFFNTFLMSLFRIRIPLPPIQKTNDRYFSSESFLILNAFLCMFFFYVWTRYACVKVRPHGFRKVLVFGFPIFSPTVFFNIRKTCFTSIINKLKKNKNTKKQKHVQTFLTYQQNKIEIPTIITINKAII